MQKPAQSLLREKSRALGEWIALDLDQAGDIKALKEEEAYDELLEERRYLRRQVELINQWNEQGVLNERMAAERKEDEFERGVNRQRDSWREQEFLMRYEATYLAFRESAARFERWMAEGGLDKLEAKMIEKGMEPNEVAFVKGSTSYLYHTENVMKNLPDPKDIDLSDPSNRAAIEANQRLVQSSTKTIESFYNLTKNPNSQALTEHNINQAGNIFDTRAAIDSSQNASDPKLKKVGKQLDTEEFRTLERSVIQSAKNIGIDLTLIPPEKRKDALYKYIWENPEKAEQFRKEMESFYGKNVGVDNVLTQFGNSNKYNQIHQNTISVLNSTALLFAKQTDSPSSEVGPITAFTDYLSGLRKALDSSLKEVAVENTEKVLSSNSRNYAVIKIIDPNDSTKTIETFVEAGNSDYSLGNYGKIVGDKFIELAKREHYPALNDFQYLNLISEMLSEFILPDEKLAKKMVLQENGKEESVNQVNTALMKMAAISQIIRKNDTMSNFKGAPEEYAKNFNSNLEAQANILQLNLEKSLKEQYDFYKAHPDLAKKAAENAAELVKAGSFNSKDFYDMSAELQQQYTNKNENVDAQTSELAKQANDDTSIQQNNENLMRSM